MVEAFLIGITVAAIPSYWFKKKIYIDENEILISNNLLRFNLVNLTLWIKPELMGSLHKPDDGEKEEDT